MAIKYYRPYLTLQDLQQCVRAFAETDPKLAQKFNRLLYSANVGLVKPSHTAATSVEESIGLVDTTSTLSPAARRKAAYDKKLAEGIDNLTAEEAALAETYEWETGI